MCSCHKPVGDDQPVLDDGSEGISQSSILRRNCLEETNSRLFRSLARRDMVSNQLRDYDKDTPVDKNLCGRRCGFWGGRKADIRKGSISRKAGAGPDVGEMI